MKKVRLLQFALTRRARGVQELVRCYQHQSQMSPEQPVQLDRVIRQAKEYLQSQEFSAAHSSPIFDSLFVNQMDVISTYMGKLIGSGHPILTVASDAYRENRDLYPESDFHGDGTNWARIATSAPIPSLGLRALIVLLVSKAMGTRQECDLMEQSTATKVSLQSSFSPDLAAAIADKQMKLAEVTELIYAAYMLHETVVEVPSVLKSQEYPSSPDALRLLQDGNDLATLMGDLLLAKSSCGLASIKNQKVTELMSDSIGDFAESQFVTPIPTGTTTTGAGSGSLDAEHVRRGGRSSLLPTHYPPPVGNEGDMIRNVWYRRNQFGVGSLLGHSCYCSVLIGGHEDSMLRNLAYKLGENLGLLLQASKELAYFLRKDAAELEKDEGGMMVPVKVGIYSLPVIHAVMLKMLTWETLEKVAANGPMCTDAYVRIFKEIQQNSKAIENTMETVCSLQDDTVKILSQLPSPSPQAVRILLDLIQGLTHPA